MTTVTELADELLDALNEQQPLPATLAGFREYDAQLSDYSEAAEAAAAARFADLLARARALDPAAVSVTDRVTLAVIENRAEAARDQLLARAVEYTVTPYFVAPAAQLLFGLPQIGIAEPAHAESYLARLRGIPGLLAALAERHRSGVAENLLPVRRLSTAAVAHLDRYLASGPDNPLRRPTPAADADAEVEVEAFAARRDKLLDGPVREAFGRYRDVLAEEIAPAGRTDEHVGLCWLPGGDDTYERLIRVHTTVARTAGELHRTGLEMLERLAAECGPEGLGRLRTHRVAPWRDGTEMLVTARALVAGAEEVAPRWFGRLPRETCVVDAVPATEAPAAPGAYYLRAALDGSRPPMYLVNTHRAGERNRLGAEAVAFHEAVPGHHVQVGLALELTELPMLRRVAYVDAFAEGWGLYAERLADEMGLYPDDEARLGMVAGEALRAARLVVDTGLHAHGWSRERAVDFLRAHTALSEVEIEQETDRYIADPGQALTYLVGRLEIDRLRADAQTSLGERFDLRGFHDEVLHHGEIPLGALAEIVDDWVTTQS